MQSRIESQIAAIMAQSIDPQYNAYLQQLLQYYKNGVLTEAYVWQEINRTWNVYQQRLMHGEIKMTYSGQSYPNMQAKPVSNVQNHMGAQQIQNAQQTQNVQQMQNTQMFTGVLQMQHMQVNGGTQQTHGKNGMEFAIGAGVLSVVGVIFVLIAFVMLGINYMNSMLKGMCMYGIAGIVLLGSELFLRRKMPKFAIGITALGICGMYLATILNFSYFKNFNGYVAMGISVAVSVIAVIISKARDSGTMKIISFLGSYICLVFMKFLESQETFLIVTGILVLINLMTIFLPVKKYRRAVDITHSICHVFFAQILAICALIAFKEQICLYYLLTEMLIQTLIYYRMSRSEETKIEGLVVYLATNLWLLLTFIVVGSYAYQSGTYGIYLCMGVLLLIFTIAFILFRKEKTKWIFYWMFSGTVLCIFSYFNQKEDAYYRIAATVAVLGVFLLSKCLSRIKMLRISELLITGFTVLQALHFFLLDDLTYAICFLAAFVISLLAAYYDKPVYEETVLLVIEVFIMGNFHSELKVAIMMAVFFIGTVTFNSIGLFKSKYVKVINYINLALIGFLYASLIWERTTLSCIIMLILGVLYLIICMEENYGMNFRIKRLLFIGFLCYMTLIWDIPISVLKSIILMVIAIAAVVTGFILKEKKLRIGGLVLTLAVCGKIALYDFPGAASTEKMILFMVVGLIVLAISGIYIALEKSLS